MQPHTPCNLDHPVGCPVQPHTITHIDGSETPRAVRRYVLTFLPIFRHSATFACYNDEVVSVFVLTSFFVEQSGRNKQSRLILIVITLWVLEAHQPSQCSWIFQPPLQKWGGFQFDSLHQLEVGRQGSPDPLSISGAVWTIPFEAVGRSKARSK